jgi:glycerophosphoryl diester phosphodiesterase
MNKRRLSIILIFTIALAVSAQDKVSQIREKLLKCDESSVIVASHRGDWRNFPENSLEAIESAIKMGVDIVEIDLQRTKDGELILMHDATLNRTSTGTGAIADTTLAYIQTLKLRNGCNIRTKHKVPTLREALILAKGKVMLNLDKADRYFEQVYELMKETGTTKQIVMKGNKSAEEVKQLYGDYLKDVIYMPIVKLDNDNAEEQIETFIRDMHPVAFELLFREDTNRLPLKLKDSLKGRTLIWYNTLWDTMAGGHDDDASLTDLDNGYGYLIDALGARIIQTDRPQFLLNYLRSRNLHE